MPAVIKGEPGTRYVNDTPKILYQFFCSFINSCAQCISLAGQIGPYWPIPLHRGCDCQNVPIPPGGTANPFVDYRAEVEKLPPQAQARVMGVSNLALVKAGIIKWDDVVTPFRIRPLKEVIGRFRVTIPQMESAGIPANHARRMFDEVHNPTRAAQDAAVRAAVDKLHRAGVDPRTVVTGVAGRVGARVGVGAPPSGPVVLPLPLGSRTVSASGGTAGAGVPGSAAQGRGGTHPSVDAWIAKYLGVNFPPPEA